jgi:hypothetical protein
MSRSRFRDLHAVHVQFADSIVTQLPGPSTDERKRDGYRQLADGLYADAARSFHAALAGEPADQEAHFGLALSLLGGRRPHRHSAGTLRLVIGHLRAAPELVEARLLQLLVAEDHGLWWRRARRTIPPHVVALAEQLPPERAELILRHVPACEARTWRALHGTAAPAEMVVVVIGGVGSEERRSAVHHYFEESPDTADAVFADRLVRLGSLIAFGSAALLVTDGVAGAVVAGAVAVVVLAKGAQQRASYRRQYAAAEPKPSDAQMDELLRDDLHRASERALQRLGLTGDELELHSQDVDPLGARGTRRLADQRGGAIAVFGPTQYASGRIGMDRRWRFATYEVMVICPTGHHLGIYECDLDLASGHRLHEETHEYHYADVVAVRTMTITRPDVSIDMLDPSAHHRIALGRTAQREFQVIVSSGDRSSIIVGIENERDDTVLLQESGIDLVIDAVRRMLREKKGGIDP